MIRNAFIFMAVALLLPLGSMPTPVHAGYCSELCANLPARSLTDNLDRRDDCERVLEEAGHRCETAMVPYPSAPRRRGPVPLGQGAYAPYIPDSSFYGLY